MNETLAIIITVATACGACGAFGTGLMKYLNQDEQESVSDYSLKVSSSSSSDDENIGSDHTIEDILHEIAQRASDHERNSDTEIDIRISIHTEHVERD